jgi:hypothetical protein
MKPRHAAALALVLLMGCGTELPIVAPELPEWEIMEPPQIAGRPEPTPDETAPLSKWVVVRTDNGDNYPTQNECELALERLREGARHYPPGFPELAKPIINLYDKSRCVSIDDPAYEIKLSHRRFQNSDTQARTRTVPALFRAFAFW